MGRRKQPVSELNQELVREYFFHNEEENSLYSATTIATYSATKHSITPAKHKTTDRYVYRSPSAILQRCPFYYR